MIDLERSLEELAGRIEIPGEPWFADDVLRRLDEPRVRPIRRRMPLVVGLVAAAIIVLLVVPGPRRAVGRWLGFDSVRIEPGAPAELLAIRADSLREAIATAPLDRLVIHAGRLVSRTRVTSDP